VRKEVRHVTTNRPAPVCNVMQASPAQLLVSAILVQQAVMALAWLVMAVAGHSRRAALHWASAAALLALTVVALLLRSSMPLAANALLPVTLGVLSLMVLRRGVQIFGGGPPSDREQLLVFALFLLGAGVGFHATAEPGWVAVSVLTSSAMAYTLLRTAADGFRLLGHEFGRVSALACVAPFALLGSLFALRAVVAGQVIRGSSSSGDPGGVNLVIGLAFLAMVLILNLALGAMVMQRLLRHLQHLTLHDPLTGLLNRRGLQAVLSIEHQRLRRWGHAYAVLAVDIDHFKRINDRWGHPAGDAVLTQLAGLLRGTVRETDRVARLGGEEFCLLLIRTPVSEAVMVAGRVLQAVREAQFEWQGQTIAVTVSVGLASAHDACIDSQTVLQQADTALYGAKAAGRDRLVDGDGVVHEAVAVV
jgi:diguanylate cyclase (GGDEF)-like protein